MANNLPSQTRLIFKRNIEDKMFTEFIKHRLVCLSGMPGVGKSTLAIEFGYHRTKSSSATVRFFKASSVAKVTEDYIGLAKDLQITDENEENRIRGVNSKLTKLTKLVENKPILFVFDNVEDYKDVEKYISNLPERVSVLLTVRSKEIISNANQGWVIEINFIAN